MLTSGELDLPDDLRSCLARSELRELVRGLGLLPPPRHRDVVGGQPVAMPAPEAA